MEPADRVDTKAPPELLEDGYEWRKYGQKHSLDGTTRSYFRCRRTKCNARKWIEWSTGQPGDHRVVYKGIHSTHACSRYDLLTQVLGDRLPPYDPSQRTGDQ